MSSRLIANDGVVMASIVGTRRASPSRLREVSSSFIEYK